MISDIYMFHIIIVRRLNNNDERSHFFFCKAKSFDFNVAVSFFYFATKNKQHTYSLPVYKCTFFIVLKAQLHKCIIYNPAVERIIGDAIRF
jgi:hypothetical protein